MRTILSIAVGLVFFLSPAQSQINKSFPVKANEQVVMKFDYPETIRVSTWEGNEIQITGTVDINNNESNQYFNIKDSKSANSLLIEGKIKDIDKIPHRITLKNGNGKIVLQSEEDLKKYTKENNLKNYSVTNGASINIVLNIKIPKTVRAKIESTYGVVELVNYNSNIDINAIYGGIDAKIAEKITGKIMTETQFGKVYSNLDAPLSGKDLDNLQTFLTATPGSGPQYNLQSKFGNIYLRK